MNTILVKTPPGFKCPREGRHRDYITDDPKGAEVLDTVFYRRLVNEGSLLLCPPASDAAAPAAPALQVAAAAPAPAAPVAPAAPAAQVAAAPDKLKETAANE
jgi:hypothetical protein